MSAGIKAQAREDVQLTPSSNAGGTLRSTRHLRSLAETAAPRQLLAAHAPGNFCGALVALVGGERESLSSISLSHTRTHMCTHDDTRMRNSGACALTHNELDERRSRHTAVHASVRAYVMCMCESPSNTETHSEAPRADTGQIMSPMETGVGCDCNRAAHHGDAMGRGLERGIGSLDRSKRRGGKFGSDAKADDGPDADGPCKRVEHT